MTREDQARRRTVLQAARELRGDDPPPKVEELVDFVAGQPSAEVAERVRDHVVFEDAPRQMVLDLAALRRGEEGGELSDQEVEDHWQTLMARIEDDPAVEDAGPGRSPRSRSPRSRTSPVRSEESRRQRASRRRWRQTVSDVLAASFFLTTISLGYHVLTTDDESLGFSEIHTLYSDTASVPRGTQQGEEPPWQDIEVRDSTFAFSFETEVSAGQFTVFEIEFFDQSGDHVKSFTVNFNPLDSPKLGVSRDWLPAGRYLIVLLGRGEDQQEAIKVGEYPIRLNYDGDPPH